MVGSGSASLSNTLTDFEIAIDAQNSYRPEISYAPAGEYRLIDTYSNSNLNKIDLNVDWKDKWGPSSPCACYRAARRLLSSYSATRAFIWAPIKHFI
jgi:hypothetical protein